MTMPPACRYLSSLKPRSPQTMPDVFTSVFIGIVLFLWVRGPYGPPQVGNSDIDEGLPIITPYDPDRGNW